MNVVRTGNKVLVHPDDCEFKRKAFESCAAETVEMLLDILRSHGIEVPETPYEKTLKKRMRYVRK